MKEFFSNRKTLTNQVHDISSYHSQLDLVDIFNQVLVFRNNKVKLELSFGTLLPILLSHLVIVPQCGYCIACSVVCQLHFDQQLLHMKWFVPEWFFTLVLFIMLKGNSMS
jgi:hypothetical protein